MDTIVNLKGGNPGGKAKYFLNDDATVKKLKRAAAKQPIEVKHNSGSKTITFSTGSYVSVVLALVRAWQNNEGHWIAEEQVDNMKIFVTNVEAETDLADTIVHYLVKLVVDGKEVTVTCFDTTLTMLVRAGSMLETYFNRVLFPYLEDEIKVHARRINEINAQVLAHDARKTTTRRQHNEFMKRASILELPSSPSSSRLRTLSSPSTPVSRVLAAHHQTELSPNLAKYEAMGSPVVTIPVSKVRWKQALGGSQF